MLLNFSQRLLRFCFYSIASIIISLAMALVVLRITLPDLAAYKSDIEDFISEEMKYPVTIGEIHASWDGWIPNLDLQHINIFDPESQQSIVQFKNAHIKFDLFDSVSHQTLIPSHIMIGGTELTFARLTDGSIIIVESGTNLSAGDGDNQALTNWFKQQNNIILEDAKLSWIDQQHHRPPVQFEKTFIELSSDKDQIVARGTADLLQGEHRAAIRFDVELFGDITSDGWSGTVNVKTDQFYIADLLQQQSAMQINIADHPGNGELITRFKNAKLNQLAASVQYDMLQFGDDDSAVLFNDLAINLDMLHRDDEQWIIDLNFENRTDENIIYKGTSIRAITQTDTDTEQQKIDLALNYLPLKNILAISRHIPELDSLAISELITDGELHNLRLRYQSPIGQASQQSTQRISVQFDNITLNTPKLYNSAKTLTGFNADLMLTKHHDNTTIAIDELVFNSEDFPVKVYGSISTEEQTAIDLNLEVEQIALNKLSDYLPNSANEPLKEWIQTGLLGGVGQDLKMTAKGPLHKFPYPEDKDGQLRLTTRIEQGDIQYQQGWPVLQQLNGVLSLAGTELTMQVEQADIMSATVQPTKAWIPNVLEEDPKLFVQGSVSAKGEMLGTFIDQSPLQERKSLQIINQINLKGPTSIRLDLDIPLYPEDLTAIDGTLSFLGNSIDSEDLNMQMNEFKGDIHFTRETVFSDTITANYFDRIVTLTIPKVAEDESEYILISGAMDNGFIRQQLNHYVPDITDDINPYLDYISGQGLWRARYSLAANNDDDTLNISSDLEGIELAYPMPLYKAASQSLPLKIKIPLSNNGETPLSIALDTLMLAKIHYTDGEDSQLTALAVAFGEETQTFKFTDRIELRGRMTELELSSWIELVSKANEQTAESEFDPNSIFNNRFAQLDIQRILFEGQQFSNVSATVDQQQGNLNITTISDDIQGSIYIPHNFDSVNLNLTHIKLQKPTEHDAESEPLDPRLIPVINARINQFYYDEHPLGELDLEMSRIDSGLAIEQMILTSENVQVAGNGLWTKTLNTSQTEFKADINADSVNDLRRQFNFEESPIEDGKLSFTIDANWTGSPFELDMSSLNGDLYMDIQDGSILDIDPKAGRLFGLLSIQSLPKRLLLDFSDLFGEGLQFDYIRGNFSITNGQAFTNDLVMSGTAVDIAVSGRTGLVDEDYDQIVTVNPKISDSLPVAGALFGPVGIGVGAAFYFAGEIFDSIPEGIDKLLQIKYTITGSWDDPIVEKYQATGTLISEPANSSPSSISEAIKK